MVSVFSAASQAVLGSILAGRRLSWTSFQDTAQPRNGYGCPRDLWETAPGGSGDNEVHTKMFHQGILQKDPTGTTHGKYILSSSFLALHTARTQCTTHTSNLYLWALLGVGESREMSYSSSSL